MSTQHLLDERCVAAADGVTFHLNPAVKHPENPVLSPGEPQEWDSLQVSWPGTVLYDADARLFRCWYSGMDAVQADRPKPCPWAAGYAESRDGVHWEKPALAQVLHRGGDTNRVKPSFEHWFLSTVWLNPDRSDPERRFLSLWTRGEVGGLWAKDLASSPDGKRWRFECTPHDSPGRMGLHDISQVVYDPAPGDPAYRILAYTQFNGPRWDGKIVRVITAMHGSDELALAADEDCVALAPQEGIDEELHFAAVLRVGDSWLMLFESDRFSQKPIHGDLRLAVSDDGRHFRRVHPRQAVVATGGRGAWDENLLVTTTAAMQEVGDEVRIYYFGCPGVYTNWPASYAAVPELRGSLFYPVYLGLATLPRDRFGYARGPGSLITRPIRVGRGGAWLNAEGDGVAVEAVAEGGAAVALGRLDGERSEGVYRRVRWDGGEPGGPLALRVTLSEEARLYSVRTG